MAIGQRSASARGLTALFEEHDQTLTSVALLVGVSSTLMQRIVADRQPMPLDLAETIGHVLGISSAEVLGAVSRATTLSGPRSHRPAPARPILGDAVPPVMYSPTVVVELP